MRRYLLTTTKRLGRPWLPGSVPWETDLPSNGLRSRQAQYRRENPDVSVGDVKKLLKSLEGRVTAEEKGELSEVLNALSVAHSLTVNVASVSGSVSTFTLGSFATIGDVKSRMSADEAIPVRQQAILHSSSDKPLQENTELHTLDPLHHSSIELLLS